MVWFLPRWLFQRELSSQLSLGNCLQTTLVLHLTLSQSIDILNFFPFALGTHYTSSFKDAIFNQHSNQIAFQHSQLHVCLFFSPTYPAHQESLLLL